MVRASIKRFLEKKGYHGPLTVTAFGKLSDLPVEILREVYSSGINLSIVTRGNLDLDYVIGRETYHDLDLENVTKALQGPSPFNVMVISDPKTCPYLPSSIELWGHNRLHPYPVDSLESLLMEEDSGVVEEVETVECEEETVDTTSESEEEETVDTTSESEEEETGDTTDESEEEETGDTTDESEEEETGEYVYWDCFVCRHNHAAQSFEDFMAHLCGEKHREEVHQQLGNLARYSSRLFPIGLAWLTAKQRNIAGQPSIPHIDAKLFTQINKKEDAKLFAQKKKKKNKRRQAEAYEHCSSTLNSTLRLGL
ncbi:PREDICTED: X-linked retinitis pigmentosa GTPase regulator-interacting protein 1-like isoform X2 [Camelina sativa]|uniref:X-linked retinitis pigmentosa GTPase regulator-interacting protein 1-like isoform X2 n=1 Tax=Camelina sativa TaxID=90675 RepID=A0ABM0X504_CAMSA|nr:PREDICTED: X-linked retinitis pigmentosa GTPase regulator-interacting protein 1-like isoform X2 [Camelina sativa]